MTYNTEKMHTMNTRSTHTIGRSLRNLILFSWILGFAVWGSSQTNFTLYNLNETAQAHYLNPAFRTKAKVYVSFPLGYQSFGVSNSGFTLNHLLQTRAQDDSLVLNPGLTISKMAKLNYLNGESTNEIFAFAFGVKDNYFSFGVANKFHSSLVYPKDLFVFGFEGNGKSLLGQRASLDGMGFNLLSYVEYAVGYNRKVNEKLTVGGRIKLLSGIANVHMEKSELGITTDAESFALTIDGSAAVNTSGIKPFYDSLTPSNYNPSKKAYNFSNRGFALDLGVNYELTEKIRLSASVVDLGSIQWKTENANFKTNNVNYTFNGVYINDFLNDSTSTFEDKLTDTLETIFSQQEDASSYRTGLYTRFYLGGNYAFHKSFNVGATLFNEIFNSKYRAGLLLSANVKVNNWFAATVNYSMYARSFTNMGVGFTIKAGPIQWFAISDNVLGFVFPQASKNFHFSTGLNLLIGNTDKQKESKAKFD